MRRPLFGGNWKMHKTVEETESFLQDFINESLPQEADTVLFPAFPSLGMAHGLLKGSRIGLGAQNFHPEIKGAFTGEVSLGMLKNVGVRWVLVGHSERRTLFHESDDFVALKVRRALDEGVSPMLCVGETLEQKEAQETGWVLTEQTQAGLSLVQKDEITRLTIAYEPVWAIGTGKNASEEDAQSGCARIREVLNRMFGSDAAEAVRIVYGGSVKPGNIASYMAQKDVDGGLVGGASLIASDFGSLIRNGMGTI